MLLVVQPGPNEDPRYFKPEVVSAWRSGYFGICRQIKMTMTIGGIETKFHKGADESKAAPKKGKGKEEPKMWPRTGRKEPKVERLRKGKQVLWGYRELGGKGGGYE
jgi:hypothetical protein